MKKGKVISHKIAETVIRVDERMCYTDVKNILEDTDEVAKKRYEALNPHVFLDERAFRDPAQPSAYKRFH